LSGLNADQTTDLIEWLGAGSGDDVVAEVQKALGGDNNRPMTG